ncbi:MAG: hypothetical protein KTR31_07735 [Myxococcales bacterium]|nr:hypothetical protein [Myxococcales bacterium]
MTRRLQRLVVLVVLTTSSMSCAKRSARQGGWPSTTDMRALTFRATETRNAMARGDYRGSKKQLASLSDWAEDHLSPGDLPEEVAPFAARLRTGAFLGTVAETLPDAAAAFGEVMAACGDCHGRLGLHVPYAVADVVSPEPEVHAHARALQGMWAGVLTSDPARWRTGAFAFLEVPLGPPTNAAGLQAALWSDWVTMLHELDLEVPSNSTRAALFVELLATCSGCHDGDEALPRSRSQGPTEGLAADP